MAGAKGGERKSVIAALIANLLIAATKFAAAMATGSSSMLTEAVHSLVDTSNQGLLLYGMHRSRKPPDALHPFGYGREIYFWSFVVALLIFSGGAAVSIYEGILHIESPRPIERPLINFLVLGAAFLFEGISWSIAVRTIAKEKGDRSWWRTLRDSKTPATLVVMSEDTAALLGIVTAAVFIAAAILTGHHWLDGAGSIAIGLILGTVAILLARETKGLLIGEAADPEVVRSLRRIASAQAGIEQVQDIRTTHLRPDEIQVVLTLQFREDLGAEAVTSETDALERAVRDAHPNVTGIFIRPA